MREVFIIKTSSFLPNQKVDNDQIEDYLGLINGKASKTKQLILRNNRIKERYYAHDLQGQPTHTNAEMTASAIKNIIADQPELAGQIDLLSCGTSSPDQLMPSHAVMTHGYLPELGSIEVVSPSGVCCSGMHALKYAFLSIKSGEKNYAVTTGSERLGITLRSENYEDEVTKLEQIEDEPILAFEKDFLRWMLSDGAGAFLLHHKPNTDDISLRVDWLEAISYADTEPVCMYMGSDFDEERNLVSYKNYTAEELVDKSIFSIKQDTKLLGKKIVKLGFDKLSDICKKHHFNPEEVDFFLPHLSSYYFENKIDEVLRENGIIIEREKWFTNLGYKGNVGAGSIYLMVDELFHSGKLQKGNKVLLAVPESSRFSYVFALFTVV